MKKLFSLCTALLLLLGLLAGCGTDQKEPDDPDCGADLVEPAALQPIVITEPVRGYHWAPVYLAQTLGFFAEEGLDAEFQTVSGTDSSTPVFSGDAQFGLRGIEMALMANEAGQACKVLISTTSHYPYQLIGASEAYSTVDSLRGQVLAGGQGASSAPHAFSKAILLHAGMEPDEDAYVISMASAGYLAAIRSGEIQAAVSTNPWAAKALLDNGGVVIVDGSDEAAMEELMGTTTYELFTVFTSDAFLAEDPETVQRFVTAVAKAIDWMNEATAEEIATALLPLFEGRYEELLYSAQVDQESRLHNPTGYHTDSGFAAALSLTQLSGGITGPFTAEEIYNETFLTAAWETLGK